MGRTRFLAGIGVTIALAAAFLFGGSSHGGRSLGADVSAASTSADANVLSQLLVGLAGNQTEAYVASLERRLRAQGQRGDTLLLLGFAYQQRARETGNPRFFTLSEQALRRARLFPEVSPLADSGLASLAVSRHRFQAALPLARTALHANSDDATALGALGDAFLNSGRYHDAFVAYDRMAFLSPSVASYSRIAHARELLGRPRAAAEALDLALTLRVPVREHRAAALVQRGNLQFNVGALRGARRSYRAALSAFPGYVHAEAGLAHVDAALGDFRSALPLFREVVRRLPLPQYAIWQGDALHAAGQDGAARRAYALVSVIQRVQAANGVRTELQSALFDLDHDRHLRDALRRARLAHRRAPSIDAEDVLGWALLRNGRCGEAAWHARRALRLGTHDALKFFHRGMIERCLGHSDEARLWFRRALALNPQFSLLWAPVARRYAS
jgi:tetratricopeptide (TPR) repeat protein